MTSKNDMLITRPHFLFTVPPDNSKEPRRPAASPSVPAAHHTEFFLPGAAQPVLPVLRIHQYGPPGRFGGWPVRFLSPSSSDPSHRRWRGRRFVLCTGDNNFVQQRKIKFLLKKRAISFLFCKLILFQSDSS